MESILKVEGLVKTFGPTRAVDGLSFRVERGQVVGILGPNGSGKTTTLSIILGIKHPSSGEFSWFNQPPGQLSNKRIGSLIEIPYFYPYLNLEKNLQIAASIKGIQYNEIEKVLDIVNLRSRSKSKYYTLSLGMKQRLALASALLGNPEVLVLDEPTNGLDPEGIAEFRSIIIEQSKIGKTIILASHILDEVEKICSHVIILKGGKAISQGSVAELLNEKQLVSISSENLQELKKALLCIPGVILTREQSHKIVVELTEGLTTAFVNRKLVEQGVIPSSIEVERLTLESQFLELVKNNNTEAN